MQACLTEYVIAWQKPMETLVPSSRAQMGWGQESLALSPEHLWAQGLVLLETSFSTRRKWNGEFPLPLEGSLLSSLPALLYNKSLSLCLIHETWGSLNLF